MVKTSDFDSDNPGSIPGAPAKLVEPRPGDWWELIPKKDPWGPRNPITVRIWDVKDGWVRYDMGGSFDDLRMELDLFIKLCKLKTASYDHFILIASGPSDEKLKSLYQRLADGLKLTLARLKETKASP